MARLLDGTRIYGNATIDSNLVISGNYAATSTTTGSLQLTGGAGITGNLYVGGNLSIAGNTTFINTTTISTTDTIAAPTINAGTFGNASATFYGANYGATSAFLPTANNAVSLANSTNYMSSIYGVNYFIANALAPVANAVTSFGTSTAMPLNDYAVNYNVANALAPVANAVTSFGTSTAMPLNNYAVNYNVANVILPIANTTASIGTAQRTFQNIYAVTFTGTSTTAKYADLAEMYHSDSYYSPGTVMILGGDYDVTVSTQSHDTAVAGVVSTNPAYLMNDNFEHDNWLPIALTGRVPCLVRGPVNKGTLLVSSSERGVACALDKSLYEPGCIIGKSMDIILDDSIVKIEIAVGRF